MTMSILMVHSVPALFAYNYPHHKIKPSSALQKQSVWESSSSLPGPRPWETHFAFDRLARGVNLMKRSMPVSPDDVRGYARQARALVDETLRAYATYGASTTPLHDKWQWKPLKTFENLHVFKERHPTTPPDAKACGRRASQDASRVSMSAHSTASSMDRPTRRAPTPAVAMAAYTPAMAHDSSSTVVPGASSIASLVVTGHLSGSLADAMYGLQATDAVELQLRVQCMTDTDLLETAFVRCLEGPSRDDPFRCLGIQWHVRGEPSRLKTSSRHRRDFVLLVASGIVYHKVGASEPLEIGYHLSHSIECDDDGGLKPGLVRGYLTTCTLFTPSKARTHQLEVFSRGYVDFRGKMQEHQATSLLTTFLLANVTQAAYCGQMKKLGWVLTFPDALRDFRHHQVEAKTVRGKHCAICERKLSVLATGVACNLCLVKVCSRCRVHRDVFLPDRSTAASTTRSGQSGPDKGYTSDQVHCASVTLCKTCQMTVSRMDARGMVRRTLEARDGWIETMSFETPIMEHGSFLEQGSSLGQGSFLEPHLESEQSGVEEPQMPLQMDRLGTTSVPKRDRTAGTGTGTGTGTFRHRVDDHHVDVLKHDVPGNKLDQSQRTEIETANSSFASTLPSQHSSFDDSELTLYHSHHPTSDVSTVPAYVDYSRADLVRKMQELQMKSESVYQLTSQLNANTRYRHVPLDCSTSISELD